MLEFTLKQHINPITIWTLSARKWFSLCTRMSNCGTVNVHSSSKVHNKSTTPLKRCQTAHILLILDIWGTLLRTFFIIGQLAKIYIDKSDKTMSYLIHIYIWGQIPYSFVVRNNWQKWNIAWLTIYSESMNLPKRTYLWYAVTKKNKIIPREAKEIKRRWQTGNNLSCNTTIDFPLLVFVKLTLFKKMCRIYLCFKYRNTWHE